MRKFRIEASEVIPTQTGTGFKTCVLTLLVDNAGAIRCVTVGQEGYLEGAPDPGGESTQ